MGWFEEAHGGCVSSNVLIKSGKTHMQENTYSASALRHRIQTTPYTYLKMIDDVVESPVASNHRQTGYNTYGDFERNMSICRLGTSRSGIHTGRAKSQPPDSLSARSKYTLGFFSQDEVHSHERAVLNDMIELRRGSSNISCAGFKR